MRKSIMCALDFHKMGEWTPEEILIAGFPTQVNARHCVRVFCEHTEIASEGILDFGPWNYSYRPTEISFDALEYQTATEVQVNGKRLRL